jgi:hypothetical protein
MEEIWKDIPNYEGYYQVSNLGRIKSLKRVIYKSDGTIRTLKERILSPVKDGRRYYKVSLHKNTNRKTLKIHQLVAMAFLGHEPCGMKMVVNHIDNNPVNNRVSNLEIVSQRENSHTHYIGTSKYRGVSWHKKTNKWMAEIRINGKQNYLGLFENEIEASIAYQNKLKEIIN